MAQVLVRNLEENTVLRLKAMAAAHGRSLEAEVREILAAAAQPRRQDALVALRDIRAASRPWQPGEPTATEMIREDRDRR